MTETTRDSLDHRAHVADPPATEGEVHCPRCGYSLRGISGAERCPECGLEVDPDGVRQSRIPWVYRHTIGRVAAYRRTAWLATVSPGKLAAEAERPVTYPDALRFRLVTCLVATLPISAVMAGMMAWYGSAGFLNVVTPEMLNALMHDSLPGPRRWIFSVALPWEAGATLPPQFPLVPPLALFVAALLMTGVASYASHPRRLPVVRQNRAVALSHYGCAPLAFLWLPVAAFMLAGVMQRMALSEPGSGFPRLINLLAVVGCVGLAAVGFLFLRSTLVLFRQTTKSGRRRTLAYAFVFPVAWVLCAVAALVGIPWVIGLVRLMLTSIRDRG